MYTAHNLHLSTPSPMPPRETMDPGFSETWHEPPPSKTPDTQLAAAAQTRAARQGVALTTCLTATLIVGSLLCTTAFLLSYLCAVHHCRIVSAHSLISTAPLGKVLTITQVTSHISPVSIPVVMGLFSLLLAADWLRASEGGDGSDRPTPMQLGILMSMCNGANLRSLFTSMKYIFKKPTTDAQTATAAAAAAPMLRRCMLTLGCLLTTSYIIAGTDAWLHASSTSALIPSLTSYHTPSAAAATTPAFGRAINATMCQSASANTNDTDALGHIITASCGVLSVGSTGSGSKLAEGIRVSTNTSTLHRVAFADDQTALLVPQGLPPNVTYEARTLGVRSQCKTITKECIYQSSDGLNHWFYGPQVKLNLDCSQSGVKYQNGTGMSPLCALDDQGVCIDGTSISSNPFTTGEVVTSNAYLNPDQPLDSFIGNTGWFVHGNTGAWNVVVCNMTTLAVTYTYASSRFLLQTATPTSVADTQHMMAAGFDGQTDAVSRAVNGAGNGPNTTTYEQAYAIELSRAMLAMGAFLYEPREVIDIRSENTIVGSELQLIPLLLFLVALLVFACQVLWCTLRIVGKATNVSFVRLAAVYLSNPLAVVQTLYGRADPARSWDADVAKRFGVETELDRLNVGPVYSEFGSVFAVARGQYC